MGKKDNLAAGVMTTLIIIIFIVTVYFCLDIFGIIDVPENLSLVRLLSSKKEELVASQPLDELIITEETIDEWINKNTEEETTEPEADENEVEVVERNVIVDEEELAQSNVKTEETMNRIYYYQLDMYGKMIYDRLYDNIENLKTGTYVVDYDTQFNELLHEDDGEQTLENAFQFGINALMFDHPEIFYLDITKMYMSTEISSLGPLKTYRVKIGGLEGESYLAESFGSKQAVDVVSEMINTVRSNFERNILSTDKYTIIKAVHDYIIDNVEYDQTVSEDNIYNIYGALINKTAVCEGYAKSFKYILDDLGIPCVIVCGVGQNSNGEIENHAWNYVKLKDKWYAVDCTWDDPIIIGSGYVSESVYTKNFLKGSREFFKDHTEDGKVVEGSQFVYPTLSEDDY